MEGFTEEGRPGVIRQVDGSSIRLQPVRLRASRVSLEETRLDCLIEAIYEPSSDGESPYLLGAVLEFQLVASGEDMCLVRAICQHEGIHTYYVEMLTEIGKAYPEAETTLREQFEDTVSVRASTSRHSKPLRPGRPRKPEYDAAWKRIQAGDVRAEVYRGYLEVAGEVDEYATRRRFYQAMNYRRNLRQ